MYEIDAIKVMDQRIILNLFHDLGIEMPIRHWRDGMTLRVEGVVWADEFPVWNHSLDHNDNLPPARHPEFVSGS